ncbi:AIPR family protein [Brevibacillus fluminis]|uniref:AIPR family protein n=1 Tax=Brevibacillus fluminis TaxID=511487 RepID=UPI003F8B047A
MISTTALNYQEFKDEWLTDVMDGNPSSVELGKRFSTKLVTQWLELDSYSDDFVYCDGAGDGGIDLAYLLRGEDSLQDDAEGDTWYLIQSKYGSAFAGTATLYEEAVKVIDAIEGLRSSLSSLSSDLIDRLRTFISSSSEKDKLVLVFATVDNLTEEEKRAVEAIQLIGKNRIGSIFSVETVCIETIYRRVLEETTSSNQRLTVKLNGQLVPSGDELLVGSIRLVDLYEFLKSYKHKTGDLDLIYEKNVRKFLGNKRKVNKGIEKTLLEKPERFGLYNNGITIVVQDFEKHAETEYELTEPFIVNGCQTTKTIWSVLLKKLDSGGTGSNPELDDYKYRLGKGIVILKIVKVGSQGEDLLIETTRYTNSQNAVTEKDFLALERDFRSWADQMGSKYNIYLEIQRGGWDSRKAQQKQNPSIIPFFTEHANCFDLLKVYSAGWLAEAGLAFGKNPPFAPGGSIFTQIVNDSNFGLNDLYAAYILSKEGEKYKFGRGAEKPTRGQTRYLYFFVLMELLKDCILQAGQNSYYEDRSFYTKCILKLNDINNKDAFNELQENAIAVIDEYMLPSGDCTYNREPKFSGDINSFLKWEQLGKGDHTPILKELIGLYKRQLRRRPEYSSIIETIKETASEI